MLTRHSGQMTLGSFISRLKELDENTLILFRDSRVDRTYIVSDFSSYRGYYEDLAIEPEVFALHNRHRAVASNVLHMAKTCLGKSFCGYKGGEYVMNKGTALWLSSYGVATGMRVCGVSDDGHFLVDLED